MILKKEWYSKKGRTFLLSFVPEYKYEGWFLFGIIPLFIVRRSN